MEASVTIVILLYQMLPDRASHVQVNLYSEQANAGRPGKNKMYSFASQEIEGEDQYMIALCNAEMGKTEINEFTCQWWAIC